MVNAHRVNKTSFTFLLKDLPTLVRWVNLVIIFIGQFTTAIVFGGPQSDFLSYLTDLSLWLLISGTVFIAAGGYIINDYYDVKIDIINRPARLVVGRSLSRRQALTAHLTITLAGILLGLAVGLKVAAVNFSAAFLLWFYSNSLKRLPLLGNIVVSLLTGISILMVGILYPHNLYNILWYAVFAFFVSLIREIIKDMEDMKGDQTFGCETLPIKYGIRKTKRVIYFTIGMLVASLEIIGYNQNSILFLYFNLLVSAPLFYFTFLLARADTRKDFAFLSTFCKIIMISGIISMFFV
jgi:4-hydroxybenzoate polyprenyltransferase